MQHRRFLILLRHLNTGVGVQGVVDRGTEHLDGLIASGSEMRRRRHHHATHRCIHHLVEMPFDHSLLLRLSNAIGSEAGELVRSVSLIAHRHFCSVLIAERKELHLNGERGTIERFVVKETVRTIVHVEMQTLHDIKDQSRRLKRDQFVGHLRGLNDTDLLQLLIERS